MPRPVVPILPLPLLSRSASRARSTSTWKGRISGQDSLMNSASALPRRLFQTLDFRQQVGRVQHHAVADVAGHAVAHDARGDQVQRGLHAVDDQRVARVVAALETHHTLGVIGQPVNDLALALVTPLSADHDHVWRPRAISLLCMLFIR
ncbi:hypothetical protein Ddc_22071 [Ditylenchus destructor]|nr:hypothetical protein Ddc_22071 [Ditylenchus destructor]